MMLRNRKNLQMKAQEYKLTQHAQKRMRERGIFYKGVRAALRNPDVLMDGYNKEANIWFKYNEGKQKWLAVVFRVCPIDHESKYIFSVYWSTGQDFIKQCDHYERRVKWCKQNWGYNPSLVVHSEPVRLKA